MQHVDRNSSSSQDAIHPSQMTSQEVNGGYARHKTVIGGNRKNVAKIFFLSFDWNREILNQSYSEMVRGTDRDNEAVGQSTVSEKERKLKNERHGW